MRSILTLAFTSLMASLQLLLPTPKVWAAPQTGLRLTPKPVDHVAERRARHQATVPSTYKEIPFVETAAAPRLNATRSAGIAQWRNLSGRSTRRRSISR